MYIKRIAARTRGPELKVGDTAPVAMLRVDLLTTYDLREENGKPRVYSVVPSLDTPVCAEQTRRFNQEAATLNNVSFFTISCDLPTAQARYCGMENIDVKKFRMLSDHKELDFGRRYGTLIPELRILCRAVFAIDATNRLRYVEYVPEVASHPDYNAVLSCLKTF